MKLNIADLENLSKSELILLLVQFAERVTELEAKLAALQKDSRTSSKPPSSDGAKRPKRNQSLRKKTGRKPGGQKGHKGHDQKLEPNPDETKEHAPDRCQACDRSLVDVTGQVIARRQERDIPPIQVFVTEHQKIGKQCPCGCWNEGQFPDPIKAPIQIGPNARSFLVYLNIAHLIPYRRLTQISQDLFQCPISEGSIDNALEEADRNAKPLQSDILDRVKQGAWVGSDESGLRVMAKRWWIWVWQNASASFYTIVPRRAYQVVKDHFGEDYKGCLVHDCYSAQNNTVAQAGHQQCHPHLIRELNFIIETEHSQWAWRMKQLLLASEKARTHIWAEGFDPRRRQHIIAQFEQELRTLTQINLTQTEEKRVQKRFKKHEKEILFFMSDPHIPFHNNDSEKAIRQAKVKQKVSGSFRSQHGAERYARLLSIIETVKKQNLNILQSIQKLFDQNLILKPT